MGHTSASRKEGASVYRPARQQASSTEGGREGGKERELVRRREGRTESVADGVRRDGDGGGRRSLCVG